MINSQNVIMFVQKTYIFQRNSLVQNRQLDNISYSLWKICIYFFFQEQTFLMSIEFHIFPHFFPSFIIDFDSIMLKLLRQLILKADMFYSSELLRYNSKTQYKTLTGGLFSLGIICVIIAGFANMIADTLNRTSIASSLTTNKKSDPPFATLVPGNETMFMFGLQVLSFDLSFQPDLNNGPQYFDVEMKIFQVTSGVWTWTKAPLQQCTREHWAMMPDFADNYDSFQIGKWLCPPLGYTLPIQGGDTSANGYEIEVRVYACHNQTSKNVCASKEEIDTLFVQYENFYFTINYINPVISPNQQSFLSYYIQGNDYVIFSSRVGSEAWIYFSDYTINSDDSIWPFSKYSVQKGLMAQQKAVNHPYGVVTAESPLASIYFAKSSNSLVYNRQVQKISAVFSYIGGLIGAITAVLFLIKAYTDISLEVSIGIKLFQVTKEEPKDNRVFNFMGFIQLTFYRILKFLGHQVSSEWPERLDRFQKEAVKQLDIELLLRRLIKLETCMSQLFTSEQLQKIREVELITLDSAKKMRLLLLKEDSALLAQHDKNTIIDVDEGSIQKEMWESPIKDTFSRPESVTSIRKHLSLMDENDPQVQQTSIKASLSKHTICQIDQGFSPKTNMRANKNNQILNSQRDQTMALQRTPDVLPPIKRKCAKVGFKSEKK